MTREEFQEVIRKALLELEYQIKGDSPKVAFTCHILAEATGHLIRNYHCLPIVISYTSLLKPLGLSSNNAWLAAGGDSINQSNNRRITALMLFEQVVLQYKLYEEY
jgi:hypothetical protein